MSKMGHSFGLDFQGGTIFFQTDERLSVTAVGVDSVCFSPGHRLALEGKKKQKASIRLTTTRSTRA